MTSPSRVEPTYSPGPDAGDSRGQLSFDLVGHARDLRVVLLPAVAIAVVAAAVVYLVSAVGPTRYESTVQARTMTASQSGTADAADAATAAAALQAAYTDASTNTQVLDRIALTAATDLSADEVTDRITVAAGTPATLLSVTALGDSAQQAVSLASAAVAVLDTSVAQRRQQDSAATVAQLRDAATALQTQLDALPAGDARRAALEVNLGASQASLNAAQGDGVVRLVALSEPTVPTSPSSPTPVPYALVTFLAVLVLAAEALVALRGRRGQRCTPARVQRLARTHRAQLYDETGTDGQLAVELALLVRARVEAGLDVVVLRGPEVSDGPGSWVDSVRTAAGQPGENHGRLVELDAAERWWLGGHFGPGDMAVLAVVRGGRTAGLVTAVLTGLRRVGTDTALVLLPAGATSSTGSSGGASRRAEAHPHRKTTDGAGRVGVPAEPGGRKGSTLA